MYEQDSFKPVARLVWLKDELLKAANDEIINAPRERWEDEPKLIPNLQIYHYHNDHLGTPSELTNRQGEVVWLADYEAWGNTARVVWREERLEQLKVSAGELQPIRFQGQSFDAETGLHYNRFRYYDPDLGMFISRDPIGFLGGFNTFAYAPNPVMWVNPSGLAVYHTNWAKDYNSGKKQPTGYQVHHIIPQANTVTQEAKKLCATFDVHNKDNLIALRENKSINLIKKMAMLQPFILVNIVDIIKQL